MCIGGKDFIKKVLHSDLIRCIYILNWTLTKRQKCRPFCLHGWEGRGIGMCQAKAGKVDYAYYRYLLLHDPYCTKIAMQILNEKDPYAARGIHIHLHESTEAVDFNEPFGAILFHQRLRTGYPLCLASKILGMGGSGKRKAGWHPGGHVCLLWL